MAIAVALVVAFCFAGCSGRASLYPVEGILTIDGKPVPQGLQVVFVPDSSDAEPCIGATNDKGRFVMYFKPGMKGLPIGKYTVSITSPFIGADQSLILPPELEGITLPDRYRQGRSTLTCKVPWGGTTYDIAVGSK